MSREVALKIVLAVVVAIPQNGTMNHVCLLNRVSR
jgi:hypothetical protein